MKWFVFALVVLFILLQYRFWVGDGSIAHVVDLKRQISIQQEENVRLKTRNQILAAEVHALKNGTDAIEGRAREDMGMVKEGETFYLIIDDNNHDDN